MQHKHLLTTALLCAGIYSCTSNSTNSNTVIPPVDTTHRVDTTHQVDTTNHTVSDSVLFSFAVMGCNRLDKGDVTGSNASTANLVQLDRTFDDLVQLNRRPDYLFLVGDLVIGKTSTASVIDAQLQAWRTHYEGSPIATSGIKLVLEPGNHETNDGSVDGVGEKEWLKIMAPYIAGSNGPGIGGADNCVTDQSKLTYSFDYKGTHFVMVNTDATGQTTSVPAKWIAKDLAAAHAAGAQHIFVLAHQPAFSYNGSTGDAIGAATRDQLWAAMQASHAEAMFSAHNHIYRRLRPSAGKSWMVIAGNGGSSLANDVGADRNFGFTIVTVMKIGKVLEKAYGREYGTNYNDPSPASQYPTTIRDTADISW